MLQKVFIISDTHFGHKKIIEFEAQARPFSTIEEHDAELVRRWNGTVGKKDTVWHLGDVYFGKDTHEILGQLNGIKKLVLGNHDHYPLEVYQRYFRKIYGAFAYSHVLLTHVPVHPNQFHGVRFTHNVHGHTHSNRVRLLNCTPDFRYIPVSVEHLDLRPTLLNKLLGDNHVAGF